LYEEFYIKVYVSSNYLRTRQILGSIHNIPST